MPMRLRNVLAPSLVLLSLCSCNGDASSSGSSSAKTTTTQSASKASSAKGASSAKASASAAASPGPSASAAAPGAAEPGDPPLKEVRTLDGRYSILLLENAHDGSADPGGLKDEGVVALGEKSGYTEGEKMFGQTVQWMVFNDEPHARAMLASNRPKKSEACEGAGDLKNEEVKGPDGATGYEVWSCATKEGLTVTAERTVLIGRTLYTVRLIQYGKALSPALAKRIFDSFKIDVETTKKLEAGGAAPAGSAAPSTSAAPKAGH